MTPHFTQKFFAENRKKLQRLLPKRYPILLVGNGMLQRISDTTYPFHQESNFWYTTGLDISDCALYISSRGTEYIFVPVLSSTKAIFDGELDEKAIRTQSGVKRIIPLAEGLKLVAADLAKENVLYTLQPDKPYDLSSGVYANPAPSRVLRSLRRTAGSFSIHDISSELAQLRSIKQPQEITALRAAIDLTVETFEELRCATFLAEVGSEYALEAAFTHRFRANGGAKHAYEPIIASGKHATTLHYIKNEGALRPGELIVADIGAEVGQYAADITRTLSLTKPTARQQAVLDEVRAIQRQAIDLLRPGVLLRDYERAVVQAMGQALVRLKLIDNPKDITQIRQYYPHATSHFLGLDVHDIGDYDEPLKEGMVLTCEPGIYIPEEGIGVRLEDDILIGHDSPVNLSEHCSYNAYVLH